MDANPVDQGLPYEGEDPQNNGVPSIRTEQPGTNRNPTASTLGESIEGPQAARGPAVRFSSKLQEIEPTHSLHVAETVPSEDKETGTLSPEVQAELQALTLSTTNPQLQHRRMSNFAFEPVSLPASRVPSNESGSRQGSIASALKQTPGSASQTPPLTPAESASKEAPEARNDVPRVPSTHLTPQVSDSQASPVSEVVGETRQKIAPDSKRPVSMFAAGPSGSSDSRPPSQDTSPATTPGLGSGTLTPSTQYSRPHLPIGDKDDPYARSRRRPQSRNLDALDANFVFGAVKDNRRHSSIITTGSSGALPRPGSVQDVRPNDRRISGFFGNRSQQSQQSDTQSTSKSSHGSMADLKRFFRFGNSSKRAQSPAKSSRASTTSLSNRSSVVGQSQLPFADDHGLQSKYGKFGKVLGSGAGGSVRLMKRSSDGVTFAVKQFRDRHPHESERDYSKKVTAEFCIGSTLHHGNIIEALDIIHEKGRWFEVMEYAPYDLFAIVMTGKMAREEIACCFLQIFAGVTYLHGMGLAHRDLKLDNVVVNEHGIMKIIDFGSAIVFRYPFETDIVPATGVVGSDPYMAPEVYDSPAYDPQPTDIWSLAIIFACMTLRRFPWKLPRVTDNSYRLFVSTPDPGTSPGDSVPRRSSDHRPRSIVENSEPNTRSRPDNDDASSKSSHHSRHHNHSHRPQSQVEESSSQRQASATAASTRSEAPRAEIKGPWRLLRLLPRESRSIISRMLELDPKKRATIDEMLQDAWIADTPVCQQVDHGRVIKATGHTHTLQAGSGDSPAPSGR